MIPRPTSLPATGYPHQPAGPNAATGSAPAQSPQLHGYPPIWLPGPSESLHPNLHIVIPGRSTITSASWRGNSVNIGTVPETVQGVTLSGTHHIPNETLHAAREAIAQGQRVYIGIPNNNPQKYLLMLAEPISEEPAGSSQPRPMSIVLPDSGALPSVRHASGSRWNASWRHAGVFAPPERAADESAPAADTAQPSAPAGIADGSGQPARNPQAPRLAKARILAMFQRFRAGANRATPASAPPETRPSPPIGAEPGSGHSARSAQSIINAARLRLAQLNQSRSTTAAPQPAAATTGSSPGDSALNRPPTLSEPQSWSGIRLALKRRLRRRQVLGPEGVLGPNADSDAMRAANFSFQVPDVVDRGELFADITQENRLRVAVNTLTSALAHPIGNVISPDVQDAFVAMLNDVWDAREGIVQARESGRPGVPEMAIAMEVGLRDLLRCTAYTDVLGLNGRPVSNLTEFVNSEQFTLFHGAINEVHARLLTERQTAGVPFATSRAPNTSGPTTNESE